LQTARRRHRKLGDLADHGAETAMPQSLFEAGEQRRLVTGLRIDDAVGQKPGLSDGGREEIPTRDAPQDLATCARGDPRSEQGSRRAVDRVLAATGDFVQRAERQPAFRQTPVHRLDTEGQHRPMTRGSPFETLNAFTKRCENRK
jgi:hypothetical protein